MLRKLLGFLLGATVSAGSALAEDRAFELLSATLDGRLTVAIVDRNGAAIAIALDDQPEIIRGLAAGAILTDLRAAVAEQPKGQLGVASGLAHSEVRVDGAIRTGKASSAETAAMIDGLAPLTAEQKAQVKALLAL